MLYNNKRTTHVVYRSNTGEDREVRARDATPKRGPGSLQKRASSSSVRARSKTPRRSNMSAKNPIRLFVTHAFASHTDYNRVFEYLEASPNFFYRNCSVPDHPPAAGGKE